MPGIYMDCSEAPYKMELFFPFLRSIRNYGVEYLFIDFGRYFPWSEKFRFNTGFTYPEEFISALDREAGGMGLKLVPVFSIGGDGGFVAESSSCRYLVPGFPGSLEVDPEASGASSFFEDIIEDLAGLYYYSPGFLFLFPKRFSERVNGGAADAAAAVDRLGAYASALDKTLFFRDIPREGIGSWRFAGRKEHRGYHEDSYLFSSPAGEYPVRRFSTRLGFLPFGFLQYLSAGTDRKRFAGEMNFTERYIEKENTVWDVYRTVSWSMSSLFLDNTGAFSSGVLNNFKLLSGHIEDYAAMGEEGSELFSRYFENSFPESFFYSRSDHIMMLFRLMETEVDRIIRRISR